MTTAREILTQALKPFGMSPEVEGLYFVADKVKFQDQPTLFLALEIAQRYGADAVYFRFFDEWRTPKPEVYVFYQADFSSGAEVRITERIRRVWNSGIVQQCYFFSPTHAKLFNSWGMSPAEGGFEPIPLERPFKWAESINKAIIDKYHARLLDSGLFWETKKGKSFTQKGTAYSLLLDSIKKVKAKLVAEFKEEEAVVKRLLVITILLKYLEDRGADEPALKAAEFYPAFGKDGEASLASVFRNGNKCLEMFQRLSEKDRLNGEIFHLSDEEKKGIQRINLEYFAKFAEGDITWSAKKGEYGQLRLWKWYSFDDLPIELISHIYEDFAISTQDQLRNKAKGVVYTPPQLVQFLLDEALPLHKDSPRRPRVLDPACGSGIFLVGVYKRLIQLWRMDNDWISPDKKDIPFLQKLLSDCIYGCDINVEAARLSYFSLSLALLDALSPAEIWENVHFENLTNSNLFGEDFFKIAEQLGKFDLIVGNPPFLPTLTKDAEKADVRLRAEHGHGKLPDNQIALLFLAQSLEMLNRDGKCGLILPAAQLLYNNRSHDYRRHLIANHKFKTIFDFTPLRSSLFSNSSTKAKPSVVAVIVDESQMENTGIRHVIIRKNTVAAENVAFETDVYDIHWVDIEDALNVDRIWQSNFMGGGRLASLVKRLQNLSNLGDYLDKMRVHSKWVVSEGFQMGEGSPELEEIRKLAENPNLTEIESERFARLRKRFEAQWITGKPYLDFEKFDHTGFQQGAISMFDPKHRFFIRPKVGKDKLSKEPTKKIFEPPHLVINESAIGDSIPAVFSNEYFTFKHQIFGIHAPSFDIESLMDLQAFLSGKFSIPLIWLFSGSVISNREGVPLMMDILSLPYPLVKLYEMEEVLLEDITEFQIDFRKNGANSNVLNPITEPGDPMLVAYAEWYRDVMNSVYKDFKAIDPVIGTEYIGIAFYLGDVPKTIIPKDASEFEKKVMSILNFHHSHQLYVRRMMIVFEENCIFIFKPNQRRYWTRSIAITDADATFADLVAQGY